MAKHADAKSRASRTLFQGAIVSVLMALAAVTLDVVGRWTHDDMLSATSWVVYATSLAQAILTSLASWTQRVIEERNE